MPEPCHPPLTPQPVWIHPYTPETQGTLVLSGEMRSRYENITENLGGSQSAPDRDDYVWRRAVVGVDWHINRRIRLLGQLGYQDVIDKQDPVTATEQGGLDLQHRTNDAIYRQPNVPIVGTAHAAGRYTGTQLFASPVWQVNRHLSLTGTFIQMQAGQSLRAAGHGDQRYVGTWASWRF